MKIRIKNILEFFDNSSKKENSKYSNTIVLLLGEEFSTYCFKKFQIDNNKKISVYNIPCKKKGKNGKQLDRWILVNNVLYQTEIKTWNSNGIGGKPLALDATIDKISNYANNEWKHIWDNSCKFKTELINKCLQKMDPNIQICDKYTKQKSLLLYWLPVASKKIRNLEDSIIFTKKTMNCEMPSITVFSVSFYLTGC